MWRYCMVQYGRIYEIRLHFFDVEFISNDVRLYGKAVL